MKVVVGLGNPGPRYEGTRHNAGFAVVEELARRWEVPQRTDARFNAAIGEARVGPEKVLLVRPLTFMNLSGRAVQSIVKFFKIPPENLVIVSDDVDLPLGAIRLRKRGSSGGQKGLESVVAHLGTEDFPRIRVGIGAKPPGWKLEDWVLSRIPDRERPDFDAAVRAAADAVELWIRRDDFDLAMNRYNTPRKKKEKGASRGSEPEQSCPGGESMGRNEEPVPDPAPGRLPPRAQA